MMACRCVYGSSCTNSDNCRDTALLAPDTTLLEPWFTVWHLDTLADHQMSGFRRAGSLREQLQVALGVAVVIDLVEVVYFLADDRELTSPW